MTDAGAIRRFPALLLEGNGITITPVGNGFRIGGDLNSMMVTPTGAGAPVLLADVLATLVAHDTGTKLITVVDDGFYDIPGTAGPVTIDDGNF